MVFLGMSIGNIIKERRLALNIKQDSLAEELGVTDQTVSKWERGITEPKASQVHQLAKVLKISEKEICQGEALQVKSDPFEFVRKVSILMQEVPHTELLVGMQEFIDDEEGFLKMLTALSKYPLQIFKEDENAKLFLHMYENGKITFDTKEEETEFLSSVFKKK